MTIYNPNITWPGTSGSSNKKKNPSTPVLTEQNTYGDYFNSLGNTSTPTISDPNIKPAESSGNFGNTYGDVLTPNELTAPTTPIYTPVFGGENSLVGNSVVGGGSVIGGNLVKPIDPSKQFDGSVVGTANGGFSSQNKGGVSDEGIIADNPKVDNSTFNTNVGSGSSVSVSPTVSKKPETQQNIPNSGNEITTGNTGTKVDTNVSVNESTGVVEQKPVTAPTTPTTDAKTEETPVMTYEEYIAEQKAIEEEKRKAALKQAQVYKERAAADAQASYMQNMSAYGVNAENMAKMGLTGGGYSDYLNAQAYAQKRDDMQVASATELAMKQQAETTYADGIAALNKEKFAYQQSEKQNKTNAYNSLLGYAMDANSGLTEESIRSMAQSAGLSESEIQNIIGTMNASKSDAESKENKKYSTSTYNMLWEAVQDPNTTYTEEGIRALAKKVGMSEEDTNGLISMFKSTQARKTEAEKKVQEEQAQEEQDEFRENSASTTSATISYIVANGGGQMEYIESIKGTLTEDDYNKLVTQNQKSTYEYYTVALSSGNNISTSEVDTLYKNGNLSEPQYNDIKALWNNTKGKAENYGFVDSSGNALAYEDAKKLLETVKSGTWHDEVNKKAIESMFMRQYAEQIGEELSKNGGCTSKTVDIFASDFKTKNFGDYTDMGKSGTGQENYAQSIVSDAKAGKIQPGQYVIMNYGLTSKTDCIFIYIGDGLFQKCDRSLDNKYANRNELKEGISFYVPADYKLNVAEWTVHVGKK